MFCCEEAVRIGNAFPDSASVREFVGLSCEEQKEILPDLQYEEHSGNTFGSACMLAVLYMDHPDWVWRGHGALCPLVGCGDYGCYASRKEEEDDTCQQGDSPSTP
jgi:hypothetical protein